MDTAERIRVLRTLNNAPQADFAQKLKIPQSAIAIIEIGETKPTPTIYLNC